ncbi:hypothetical protein [Xenorhabdus sp. TH1]|uniref:hypothetical protein n=1 Tax=Xenorhabdus sp. TH1 TaxID=3130166 RepID=UPI0030D308F5
MISLFFKTNDNNRVERYKEAVCIYHNWVNDTKIACVAEGFNKFMGVDLMIPTFYFHSQPKKINVNNFVEVSKVGSILSFTEQGKKSPFYHQLSGYSQTALKAMDVRDTYGNRESHTFSHAVTYTLEAFSMTNYLGVETHSQAWLVEDTLILAYPRLLVDCEGDVDVLIEQGWGEITAREFKKLYRVGLLGEISHSR